MRLVDLDEVAAFDIEARLERQMMVFVEDLEQEVD
jgi:hypothetical protein